MIDTCIIQEDRLAAALTLYNKEDGYDIEKFSVFLQQWITTGAVPKGWAEAKMLLPLATRFSNHRKIGVT